jgi:menaquinone-dependent protoporphyrinogen oxidase
MGRHVLIATASKHGSTLDIADEIARVLTRHGLEVTSKRVNEAAGMADLAGFDAALVGSAVYVGNWLAEAVAFVDRHAAELAQMPVWLFSSGPVGQPAMPAGDPTGTDEMVAKTRARGHRVFAGRLDVTQLGMGERMIVRLLRAPTGDYRDWQAVTAWATEIADALDAGGTREALLAAAGH